MVRALSPEQHGAAARERCRGRGVRPHRPLEVRRRYRSREVWRHLAARHGADLRAHAPRRYQSRCNSRPMPGAASWILPDDAMRWRRHRAACQGRRSARFDFVLEGGAVDHDGEGTILTTRQTLLNPNRNGWTKEARRSRRFSQAFGATKSHLDRRRPRRTTIPTAISTISPASSAPGRVVCQAPAGADDPNAETLNAIARDARKRDRRAWPQARSDPHPGRRPLSQRAWRGLAGFAYEFRHRQRCRRCAGLWDRRREADALSRRCRRCSPTRKVVGVSVARLARQRQRPAAARSTASASRSRPDGANAVSVAALQASYGMDLALPISPGRPG